MVEDNSLDFIEIYNTSNALIYKFIFFRTGFNKEIAEDLTQEVYYRALKKFNNFNYKGVSVNAWLFRIARNIVIDFYRSKNVYVYNIENIAEVGLEDKDIELLTFVTSKLELLKDIEREVILYKYMYSLTDVEISLVLNKNRVATRVLIHRSLNKLKEIVNG